MSQLEAFEISKSYGDRPILQEISLHVDPSEFLVIVGRSGTGKSTLLRILAGLEQQDGGEVYLQGIEVEGPSKKLVPGHEEIQLAHQGFELHPHMSARENIERGLLAYQDDYRDYRTARLLQLADLQHATQARPRELSGGQQQKLSIATALASEPKALLLDEPFSNLDPFSRDLFLQEIKQSASEMGTSVILVTHDTREALSVADRMMVLEEGRISQQGSPESIYKTPATRSVAEFFGRVSFLSREQATQLWPQLKEESFSLAGLRPEAMRLKPGGPIEGIVTATSYLGAGYLVAMTYQMETSLSVMADEAPAIGSVVQCDAHPQDAMFFLNRHES